MRRTLIWTLIVAASVIAVKRCEPVEVLLAHESPEQWLVDQRKSEDDLDMVVAVAP